MSNKISFGSKKDGAQEEALEEMLAGTIIHQRESELACGVWNFVVFGPTPDKTGVVLRVGVAEHMMIQQASVYMASIGSPADIGMPGMMPIEELTGGDISDELAGLEVYHMEPLRPFTITDKRKGQDLDRIRDIAFEEFSSANTAIIETPNEAGWGISVLKYLHEFDTDFPDPVISSIRNTMRDTSINFRHDPKRLH